MIRLYVDEFVGIGNFLEKTGTVYKGYILIEKPQLVDMLRRNNFDAAENKLRIWKALKWIDTEGRYLTKRVKDGETGSYKRYIKLNVSVLEQLRRIPKLSGQGKQV